MYFLSQYGIELNNANVEVGDKITIHFSVSNLEEECKFSLYTPGWSHIGEDLYRWESGLMLNEDTNKENDSNNVTYTFVLIQDILNTIENDATLVLL